MRTTISAISLALALNGVLPSALAGEPRGADYEVTITNVTRGQTFTPFLIVSHRSHPNPIFTPGEMASDELAALAEGGDTTPLDAVLSANPKVNDTAGSGGLLEPGHSVTVTIRARPGRDHISLAAMLIPTNDGFTAAQDVALPRGRHTKTLYMPAYDAGSEPNDELCVSIPGPVCGGAGSSPGVGGEDYVHIHAGIHGIGDLIPAERDWHNPVARVMIKRAP
jgi:hypothetical protein